MANISITPYTKSFFGSFLKSPSQMGSLSINNSVTNISRLGTFKTPQRLNPKKSNWDPAKRGEKLGLVWRNRKKISQIIYDYLCLPFFLLIILCVYAKRGPV
jgi:hypothetical protein